MHGSTARIGDGRRGTTLTSRLPRCSGRAPARSRAAAHPRPRGPAHPQSRPTRQRRAARHPRVPQPPLRADPPPPAVGPRLPRAHRAPATNGPRRLTLRVPPEPGRHRPARLRTEALARTRLHRPHARRGRGRLRARPLDRSRHAAHRPALAARVDRRSTSCQRVPPPTPSSSSRPTTARPPCASRSTRATSTSRRSATSSAPTALPSMDVRAGTSCSSCRPPTAPPGSGVPLAASATGPRGSRPSTSFAGAASGRVSPMSRGRQPCRWCWADSLPGQRRWPGLRWIPALARAPGIRRGRGGRLTCPPR